jgi:glycosyltransferase involved in cell wall biosynthesis
VSASRPIAIVIPAYKPDFLTATLQSIAQQRQKNFRVYVGDDDSPANLQVICQPFSQQFDLQYVRFETNWGQTNLVGHWNRCVQLTSEPWVWLFSDDDLMEPACTARLQQAIDQPGTGAEVFHFNVTKIDGSGAVLAQLPDFAPQLSARAFALARLQFALESFAPDFVFSRAAFDRLGGFVDFPLAWCSDDASWVAMADSRGICTLDGPRVHWRLSGQNISAKSPAAQAKMFEALVHYLAWLHRHLTANPPQNGEASNEQVLTWAPSWLFKQMDYMQARLTVRQTWLMAWRLRHLPGQGVARWLWRGVKRMLEQELKAKGKA